MFDKLNEANNTPKDFYNKVLNTFDTLMHKYPQSKVLAYKELSNYEFLNLELWTVYSKMLESSKHDYDERILNLCTEIMYRISVDSDKQYLILGGNFETIKSDDPLTACRYAMDLSDFRMAAKEWKEEFSLDIGYVHDYEDLLEKILTDFDDYLYKRIDREQLVYKLCEYVYDSKNEISVQLSNAIDSNSSICLVANNTAGGSRLRLFLKNGYKMYELGKVYCGSYEYYKHEAIFTLPLGEFVDNES